MAEPADLPRTPASADRPLQGVAWMVLTGFLFVGVTAAVKHVGQAVPSAQAAFLRFAFGALMLLPALGALRRARLGRGALRLLTLRGLIHSGAVLMWFYAMARIPMTDVTAMNYLTPIVVGAGAALILGERIPARRVLAVVVALAGVMVVLRPGLREVTAGHLAMLGMPLLGGAGYVIAKRLSGEVPAIVIVGALSVVVTVVLAPFAWAVWVPPTAAQTGWLALVAAMATAGHYAMTRAFAAAPITVTQPVTFLQLVWASILGWVLFSEAVDPWVVVGGTLIVAAVSVDAVRGGRGGRAQAPLGPTAGSAAARRPARRIT